MFMSRRQFTMQAKSCVVYMVNRRGKYVDETQHITALPQKPAQYKDKERNPTKKPSEILEQKQP